MVCGICTSTHSSTVRQCSNTHYLIKMPKCRRRKTFFSKFYYSDLFTKSREDMNTTKTNSGKYKHIHTHMYSSSSSSSKLHNTDGIHVFRTGKRRTTTTITTSNRLEWFDVFNPLFQSFEQATLKSVESINTKMFGTVREYLTVSCENMRKNDNLVPCAIAIAAEDVHFKQLATFLEGKRCADGRKEWIVVRLSHSDPDESRTPAAIWHKCLVSLCDFFLRDEDTKAEKDEEEDEDAGNETDTMDTDTETIDAENLVPGNNNNNNDINGQNYRLRPSTKMKKVMLEMDEESMKAMRRDRDEWRWIRDVAGGYGGMPHELLQHWLVRHGDKLKSRCTNIVLQLEGVEHFRQST